MPDEALAKAFYGNDMSDEQWTEHRKSLVPDAPGVMNARLSGYPNGVPITYVSMTEDVGSPATHRADDRQSRRLRGAPSAGDWRRATS
jgi:hypothetical protein